MEAPTKSGLLGIVCSAMGLSRAAAREVLGELNTLRLAVRADRPGRRWWDYQTVGAGKGLLCANGDRKTGAAGTLVTRREYLSDASFLAVLLGEEGLVSRVTAALQRPRWAVYLGRKSCLPAVPVLAGEGTFDAPDAALASHPWAGRPGVAEKPPRSVTVLTEWRGAAGHAAPGDAEVWFDAPISFDPPVHHPRFVLRSEAPIAEGPSRLERMPAASRPRADYRDAAYRKARAARLQHDHGLCTFCKSPATTVQHVTYRNAGGSEGLEDLRALCRLCHDAVTMLEYGLGMGLDRIDPVEPRWRESIMQKRDEIVSFRSLESRRRRLAPGEVE